MKECLPKIFVDQNEYDFAKRVSADGHNVMLDAETSVSKLKAHFFETLETIGTVHRFSRSDAVRQGELSRELTLPNSIIASFHEPPPDLDCRLLRHTKGGLMLPGGFLNGWAHHSATMNMVETIRQKNQIENKCEGLGLKLGVFAQRLNTTVFRIKHKTSQCSGTTEQLRLIYAGRFIPNKGISQIIRCLNIWPLANTALTLIGNYEPDFPISQNGGCCATFEKWFSQEASARNRFVALEIAAPVGQTELAQHFWEADIFLYPSFHEDEASGNTAHEAVLSGIPAIVTDWCGLGQLGRNTRGGAVWTYPTLGGVRYSLLALRSQIEKVAKSLKLHSVDDKETDASWVKSIFNPASMQASLKDSVYRLLEEPVCPPPEGGWRSVSRLKTLASNGPQSFRNALARAPKSDQAGIYVDGIGFCDDHYSHSSFFKAVQGLYTTWASPPLLRVGNRLHGFWRVALWDEERTLVEFGFPGPRLLRFSESEWQSVRSSSHHLGAGEVEFEIHDEQTARVMQRAIDLGYLVPHQPEKCFFPE